MPSPRTTSSLPALGAACAAALLLGPCVVAAQPVVPQTPGSLRAQLRAMPLPIPTTSHADDVREQAWRIWIAGRDGVDAAQPMLERVVSERIDGEPWHPLVDYALDALIQLRADLPPDLLARIVEERPVEGMILLSYVDDETANGVLLSTLDRAQGHEWFAAANMAVNRRPAGAVAHLLTGLRIQARITISDSGAASSGGGSFGIGCGVAEYHPGMPPWPSYRLTADATSGDVVLALGPTPVYYERRVSAAGHGPSRGGTSIDAPTAGDRLRYLAALTGRRATLPERAHRSVRRGPALDTAGIAGQMRRDIERQFANLVRELVADGFLSDSEARSLSVEVDVTIVDADAAPPQP
jgi:hypothetical protein